MNNAFNIYINKITVKPLVSQKPLVVKINCRTEISITSREELNQNWITVYEKEQEAEKTVLWN